MTMIIIRTRYEPPKPEPKIRPRPKKITTAKSYARCPHCTVSHRTILDYFKCCDTTYKTEPNLCDPKYKRSDHYPLTDEQFDKMMQECDRINRKNRKFRLMTPSYFDINDL